MFATWATKTVSEAMEILGNKDTKITNGNERPQMIKKLEAFDDQVKEIESFDWVPPNFLDIIKVSHGVEMNVAGED